MALIRRFEMGNPEKIAQEHEQHQVRFEHEQFKFIEERLKMGRPLAIPHHMDDALYAWAKWATRPQLWVNLKPTPFYKLIPINVGKFVPFKDVPLDPLSHNINRYLMGASLEDRVLIFVRYVACLRFSDLTPQMKQFLKVNNRQTYNEKLKYAVHKAYNCGMRLLEVEQIKAERAKNHTKRDDPFSPKLPELYY